MIKYLNKSENHGLKILLITISVFFLIVTPVCFFQKDTYKPETLWT